MQDEHSDDTNMSSESEPFSAGDCSSATSSLSNCFHLPADNLHGATLSMDDILSVQTYADPFLPQIHSSLENTPCLGLPTDVLDDIPGNLDITKQRHEEAGLPESESFNFTQTEDFSTTATSPMSFDIAPPELFHGL